MNNLEWMRSKKVHCEAYHDIAVSPHIMVEKGIVQVIWESTGRTQAVKVCCSWGMLGDFLKPQNMACQHGNDPAADVT